MFLVDDIVSIDETKTGSNYKLELLKEALEVKLNRTKPNIWSVSLVI